MNMSYCTFALQGIPEFDGINNLVQTLTNFFYICSVEHSATNFPQFDQYAFPPNYPALLREGDQNEIVSVVFQNTFQLVTSLFLGKFCITLSTTFSTGLADFHLKNSISLYIHRSSNK